MTSKGANIANRSWGQKDKGRLGGKKRGFGVANGPQTRGKENGSLIDGKELVIKATLNFRETENDGANRKTKKRGKLNDHSHAKNNNPS